MEFVGGGDLMYQIQRHRFSEEQARFFAAQVLLALEYLHARDIIYRDLKLDNILLGLDGYIKLADYGLCKGEMTAASVTQTFCGTPEFMAPEILQDLPYTRAVDWWAFGVLVYELLFAHAPFQGRTEQAVFRAILSGRLAFPPDARSSAKDLIRRVCRPASSPRLRLIRCVHGDSSSLGILGPDSAARGARQRLKSTHSSEVSILVGWRPKKLIHPLNPH